LQLPARGILAGDGCQIASCAARRGRGASPGLNEVYKKTRGQVASAAHAPDLEEGSDQARRAEPAPGARHEVSRRALLTFAPPLSRLGELDYPFHDRTITVTHCGRICLGRRKINLSTVFAGQNVGVKEVSDKIWLVTFMHYDLGFFDHETCRLESVDNPFEAKVLPMSPV
jgi:hypothetical protein